MKEGEREKIKGEGRKDEVKEKVRMETCIFKSNQVWLGLVLGLCSWILCKQRGKTLRGDISSSLLACFQPLMILMKTSYKNTWFVFIKNCQGTEKNEDWELILPRGIFTSNSWLAFSLWAMPTSGDFIWIKQIKTKQNKKDSIRSCGVCK